MRARRVVITGIGIVSSIGVGVDEVLDNLKENRSGIHFCAERSSLGFRSALTGKIPAYSPRFSLDRKARKSMHEVAVWAHEAAMEAIAMAHLAPADLQNSRTGVVFGNDSVAAPSYQQGAMTRARGDTGGLHSGMVFQAMNSTVTLNLGSILGCQGAAWTVSGACASGGHAIGQAAELIAFDRQDCVVCGGAQEISWESMCSFDALCAFSSREDDPAAASRPFDIDRDGLVPSGGAAAVVLEERTHALQRGAPILGEVLSYGFSCDGTHIAVPSGEGLARAMADALTRAELDVSGVDYVCAHGTSTPVGDAVEARMITQLFGTNRPWVSSVKGMVGHEMWMAGASQLVYSLLATRDGFVPGNRNFVRPDESARDLRIPPQPVAARVDRILLNSAGFGGTNACLVVRIER